MMRFKHILIEAFCNLDTPPSNYPCSNFSGNFGVHCLECPEFSYAPAPYELAMSNEFGVIEKHEEDCIAPYLDVGDYIGATEEEIFACRQLWKEICKEKIADAWTEFCSRNKLEEKHR